MKNFFKYLLFFIIALVIAKWIVIFFPANKQSSSITKPQLSKINNGPKIKEVELTIDLKALKPKVEEAYQRAQNDVYEFIDEQINGQNKEAKERLTEKDGFLDWLFGYWTGWKLIYKKVKGIWGSKDNEKKMVEDKFINDVITPGLNEKYKRINNYINYRINDYYKEVIALSIDYINSNIKKLKEDGFKDIKIDTSSIPWASVITARSGDLLTVTETTGITSIGAVVGKFVGSKVAALLGPKVLGVVEAKTSAIIAGKLATFGELIFMPIADFAANEIVKKLKYNDTKKAFEEAIDNIFDEIDYELKDNATLALKKVKNDIYTELNKQVKISAKEEK